MYSVTIPLLVTLTTFSSAAAAAADTYNISRATKISKPGCPSKCGNVTIPYPFGIGIGSGCALDQGFELNCTDDARALIGYIQVYEISDSRLRISNDFVSRRCYDKTGATVVEATAYSNITGSPFSYSDLNKLTVVGCDDFSLVSIAGGRGNLTSACVSLCSSPTDVFDGDCSGRGCCQTSVLGSPQNYIMRLGSFDNHTTVSSFNPCGYVFFGEQGRFVFLAKDLSDPNFGVRVRTTVPIVLDWVIGNLTCAQAKNFSEYGCKVNSYCIDIHTGLGGYRCSCNHGYQGNPYLDPGCIDLYYHNNDLLDNVRDYPHGISSLKM